MLAGRSVSQEDLNDVIEHFTHDAPPSISISRGAEIRIRSVKKATAMGGFSLYANRTGLRTLRAEQCVDHLVGHRRILGSVEGSQPKPYRRPAMTTAGDK
jgi:hypothetical protein